MSDDPTPSDAVADVPAEASSQAGAPAQAGTPQTPVNEAFPTSSSEPIVEPAQEVASTAAEPPQSEPQPAPQTQPAAQTATAPSAVPINTPEYDRALLVKARAKIQTQKQLKLGKIMTLFEKKGKITNDDVEKLLRCSDATASRYLSALIKQGQIRRIGKTGAGVEYVKAFA